MKECRFEIISISRFRHPNSSVTLSARSLDDGVRVEIMLSEEEFKDKEVIRRVLCEAHRLITSGKTKDKLSVGDII